MLDHQKAIDAGDYLTMVTDVTFTDGSIGPCYALTSWTLGSNGRGKFVGTAVSIRRAIELQETGYPFRVPHPIHPGDFDTFFGPDFPALGGNTMTAFVERTPEALG